MNDCPSIPGRVTESGHLGTCDFINYCHRDNSSSSWQLMTLQTPTGTQVTKTYFYTTSERGPQGWGKSDMHQEKTDLKVFVVVMPKEGWARERENIIYDVSRVRFWKVGCCGHIQQCELGCSPYLDNILWRWLAINGLLPNNYWSYIHNIGVITKEGWSRPCAPSLLLRWQRQRP